LCGKGIGFRLVGAARGKKDGRNPAPPLEEKVTFEILQRLSRCRALLNIFGCHLNRCPVDVQRSAAVCGTFGRLSVLSQKAQTGRFPVHSDPDVCKKVK
jgi:hypothetical protein